MTWEEEECKPIIVDLSCVGFGKCAGWAGRAYPGFFWYGGAGGNVVLLVSVEAGCVMLDWSWSCLRVY